MTNITKKLQALLFVTGDEMTHKELKKILEIDQEQLQTGLQELQEALANQGLSLLETENAVMLTTSPEVSDLISTYRKSDTKDLSKAAAETLSLIAYRGPMARHDVSVIRGVDSKRIVAQLLKKGLIVKTPSNTEETLYDVSIEFMQHLGITKKQDLPEFDKLSKNDNIRRVLSEEI